LDLLRRLPALSKISLEWRERFTTGPPDSILSHMPARFSYSSVAHRGPSRHADASRLDGGRKI